MGWRNIELNQASVDKLREYLRARGIKYETSGAGSLVHFEILVADEQMVSDINEYLGGI